MDMKLGALPGCGPPRDGAVLPNELKGGVPPNC